MSSRTRPRTAEGSDLYAPSDPPAPKLEMISDEACDLITGNEKFRDAMLEWENAQVAYEVAYAHQGWAPKASLDRCTHAERALIRVVAELVPAPGRSGEPNPAHEAADHAEASNSAKADPTPASGEFDQLMQVIKEEG